MGAEQSTTNNVLENDSPTVQSYQNELVANSSELSYSPHFPQNRHSSFSQVNDTSKHILKSHFNRSLSNLNKDLFIHKPGLSRFKWPTLDNRNSSTTTNPRGIVVVNPGRSSSLQDLRESLAQCETTELRDLRHISMFEPFLSTFPNNDNLSHEMHLPSSQLAKQKRFVPNLNSFKYDKLINISTNYEQYLHRIAKSTSEKQHELLAFQTKINSNVNQLSRYLQFRGKGIGNTNSSSNTTVQNIPKSIIRGLSGSPVKQFPDTTDEVKLAGTLQIETVILETSQISGLISQSLELSNYLINLINDLNKCLPSNKQLEPLSTIDGL